MSEAKAPGKLGTRVNIYLENGWAEIEELMEIQREILLHLGPVNLDLIIKAAQELKADFEAEETPEEDWRWEGEDVCRESDDYKLFPPIEEEEEDA